MLVTETPESLANEFGPRVVQIGRLLPMLTPWDDPIYVKRAWCLFELFTAIQHHGEVEIAIVLPPSERSDFEAALSDGGYGQLETVLSEIDSAAAEASEHADLEAIHQYVETLPGGFDALDTAVRLHLQGWFAEQGAVLSAPRIRTLQRVYSERASRALSGETLHSMTSKQRPSTAVYKSVNNGKYVGKDSDIIASIDVNGDAASLYAKFVEDLESELPVIPRVFESEL